MKQYYVNTAKVIAMISKSQRWQDETSEFLRSLRDQARSASNEFPEGTLKIRIPEKLKVDTDEDVKDLWDRITSANLVFQMRAVAVCRECYQKADKLLAIRLMYGVCTWKDEAVKMSDDLMDTYPDLWIKSWKMLEYSNDTIDRKIFNIPPTNQPELIRQAIFEIYQDNENRKKTLWEKYRDKLIDINSKKSKELLKIYFPEYNLPQPEQELPPGQIKVTDLLKDILDSLDRWNLQEGDKVELSGQLESMREMLAQPERLHAKWKMAKSLIPDDLDRRSQVRVEKLDKLISEVQPLNIKPQDLRLEIQDVLEQEEIPGNNKIEDKPHSRERHRHKVQSPPHRVLQRVNLHELSLEDAKLTFEAAFDNFRDDKSVGAMLVSHGYGKDKNKSVIKEWFEQRCKRLKGHRRVRSIIKGEEIIDPFDKKADLIREAVDDVDFSEIGVNSPSYTVIVFNRR